MGSHNPTDARRPGDLRPADRPASWGLRSYAIALRDPRVSNGGAGARRALRPPAWAAPRGRRRCHGLARPRRSRPRPSGLLALLPRFSPADGRAARRAGLFSFARRGPYPSSTVALIQAPSVAPSSVASVAPSFVAPPCSDAASTIGTATVESWEAQSLREAETAVDTWDTETVATDWAGGGGARAPSPVLRRRPRHNRWGEQPVGDFDTLGNSAWRARR